MSTLMHDLSCSDYNVNAAIAALALPVSPACGPIFTPLQQPAIRINSARLKSELKAPCPVQTLATLAADPVASLVDTAYLGRYGMPLSGFSNNSLVTEAHEMFRASLYRSPWC